MSEANEPAPSRIVSADKLTATLVNDAVKAVDMVEQAIVRADNGRALLLVALYRLVTEAKALDIPRANLVDRNTALEFVKNEMSVVLGRVWANENQARRSTMRDVVLPLIYAVRNNALAKQRANWVNASGRLFIAGTAFPEESLRADEKGLEVIPMSFARYSRLAKRTLAPDAAEEHPAKRQSDRLHKLLSNTKPGEIPASCRDSLRLLHEQIGNFMRTWHKPAKRGRPRKSA